MKRFVFGVMGRNGDAPQLADLERFSSISDAHAAFLVRSRSRVPQKFDYVYRPGVTVALAEVPEGRYLDVYVARAWCEDDAINDVAGGAYAPQRVGIHDDLTRAHPDIL